MKTICGLDCCGQCELFGGACAGCEATGGHPCGGSCVAAECINRNGAEALAELKRQVIGEINALGMDGLAVEDMNLLFGAYVNLEYPLPGGRKVKLLDDGKVYLGNQIERPGKERCYGVVADETILLVCEYGCGGADPEILLYKKR